jgi:hypothetical protein
MKTNIQTDLEKVYTRFTVAESVTDWLKESTEIIFDIAQKAIQENRFEVVASALHNIFDLSDEYIKARQEYSNERDAFIDHVHSRLIDSKNLVSKNTHPKIMLSIIRIARDIAISSLQIKPVRAFAGENFMPLGFITLLSDVSLSPEILKDTSYAPMSTVDYLVDIAKKAIDNDFPRTAILVTDKLGAIAATTTKLHFLYGDTIAAKANWALACILDYLFDKQNSSKYYLEHELKSVLEQINKSIVAFIEDDIKFHYATRSNIKTFFGPMAEHGLATVFIKALRTSDDKHLYTNLKILEEFLLDSNQNIMKGMDNSKYLDVKDILDNIYLVGTVFVSVLKEKTDPRMLSEMRSLLLQRFYLLFTNAISMSFKVDPNRYTIFDNDYQEVFFSLMGIMFYENKNHTLDDVLDTWANSVLDIVQKYKTQTTIEHEGHTFERHEITNLLTDLYRYLRLVGVWFNNYYPESEQLKKIILEIKAQPKLTVPYNRFGEVNMYPADFIAERWIITRPFLPFNVKYYADLDSSLFNQQIVDAFEKKLIDETKKKSVKRKRVKK